MKRTLAFETLLINITLEHDMCTFGVQRYTCVSLHVIIVGGFMGIGPHMCCWPPLYLISIYRKERVLSLSLDHYSFITCSLS